MMHDAFLIAASVYVTGFILMLMFALDDEFRFRLLRATLWPLVLIYGALLS